ncbi:uncharacterized protein LOC113855643 [Abrus precatorius]|uniref:Uncharacterized protein LOC113855643 n=1 Tax=Abrus precatorius TaxID=3816 RepID=A0A8B8KJN1_ABRPR|nr:uncharacterized protein LOC113855643 [Abrus precatorius]
MDYIFIKARYRGNNIVAIKSGEAWLEEVEDIKEFVFDHFRYHFEARCWRRLTLDEVYFQELSKEANDSLMQHFTLEEVVDMIHSCSEDKSSGSDVFNFAFLKKFWPLLKEEIMWMLRDFYRNASFPKEINSYFVALIPKTTCPQGLEEDRSISLVGCLYKVVAKLLANRLKRVLDPVIAHTQTTFVPKRLMLEGLATLNEVIDWVKKKRKPCFILKVDYEKAYDSIEWSFLIYMLRKLGFNEEWIRWIEACVCGGHLSILVNGSETKEFEIGRGLKQGDPLALFLFITVVEALGGLMRMAREKGMFQGLEIEGGGTHITHLQFADDTIIVSGAKWENQWCIKAILRCFELASGMKINFHKSKLIGVNIDHDFVDQASSFFHCKISSIPFHFLRILVGANPRKRSTWERLIDMLKSRLGSWKTRFLSIGGRVTLLNAVLNSIPIHYLLFYKMPKGGG